MTKQNVRLTTINVVLMGFLIAALAGVTWQQVGAQVEPEPAPLTEAEVKNGEWHECDFDIEDLEAIEYIEDDGFDTILSILAIDEETLWEGLDAGKSLEEIATENGVDPQAVIDALIAEEKAFIDELLAKGEISEEEANAWFEDLGKWTEFEVKNGYIDPFMVAAAAIGIDDDAFWTALEDGQSVAEIAQANGVDPQTVIDAVVAAEISQIDAELEAGLISQAEADAWRAKVGEYVPDMINKSLADMEKAFEVIEFE